MVQHHDAITGTCKDYVAEDYKEQLRWKVTIFDCTTGKSFSKNSQGLKQASEAIRDTFCGSQLCHDFNTHEPHCRRLKAGEALILYNGQSHQTTQMVRFTTENAIGIKGANYSISRSSTTQNWHHPQHYPFPTWQKSFHYFETVFLATDIPPLGYKVYDIQHHTAEIHSFQSIPNLRERSEPTLICKTFRREEKCHQTILRSQLGD